MNPKRIKGAVYRALTLSLILLVSGCLSSRYFHNKTVDETNNPAWWGELAKGEVIELNQDALLNDNLLTLNASKITDHYDSSALFGGDITVDKYRSNPKKYWPELRLLPKGTRLQCVKLELFYSLEYSTYRVYAQILNGDFQGKVVNLGYFASGDTRKKRSLVLDKSLEPMH
jgi:hypothetical protein